MIHAADGASRSEPVVSEPFDYTDGPRPSIAIAVAVAAVADSEPDAIDPLVGSIDLDAVDEVFGSTASAGKRVDLSFLVDGYAVRVTGRDGAGEVVVSRALT